MLLTALLLAAALGADPQATASSGQAQPSPGANAPFDLPVSLDRIRAALLQMPPPTLKGLNQMPAQFHSEVQEKQRFQDVVSSMNFYAGPPIAGGLYAYQQQESIWPKSLNPLVQPYAAFNGGELAQVMVTSLLERYFAGRAADSISAGERSRAARAARKEVAHAIDEYCAAQPRHGAGIQICTSSRDVR